MAGTDKAINVTGDVAENFRRIREAAGVAEPVAMPVPGNVMAPTPAPYALPDRFLSGGELLDAEFAPLEFAIEPYFPRGEVCEISGAHGIYKSTACLNACLCVATGRSWGGARTVRGRSAFISMEDSERTLQVRMKAWLDGVPEGSERDEAEQGIRENFVYLAREHTQALALTRTAREGTTIRHDVLACLIRLIGDAVLVVLETMSRLHDGPEMNEALSVFARAVERVAIECGAAVGVVRHTGKVDARSQNTDSYVGRGGGSFSDAARSVLTMVRMARKKVKRGEADEDEENRPDRDLDPVRLTHAKSSLAARGREIVWVPKKGLHGVRLEVMTDADRAAQDAITVKAKLRDLGDEGIARSAVHKESKDKFDLGRDRALRALDYLVLTGDAELEEVDGRGKTGQRATVYRLKNGAGE